MQCLILFRDASGWLPTAQEMSRCGFCVSAAALPTPEMMPDKMTEEMARAAQGNGLALAAEPVCKYGGKPPATSAGELGPGQAAEAGQA